MAIYTRTGTSGKRPSYLVRIESKDPLTGARKRINVGTFRTRKDAERAEREALTQRDRGTLADPSTTTIGDLLDAWLAVKRAEITSQSYADYEIIVRKHLKPALGALRLPRLTPARLQAQYATWTGEGMSARLIKGCHMRLSQALDYAVKLNLSATNVCRLVTAPKLTSGKPDVWSVDEASKFLSAARSDSLHPLWHLLLLEGMRRGEALGLRWRDINWDRGTAHIVQTVAPDKANMGKALIQDRTKTSSSARTVKLTEETLAALRDHRTRWLERQLAAREWADNDLIVCTATGTPINPNNVTRSFNAIVKNEGLRRIRVHDLRHTHATLLLRAGTPAKVVSERLGHAGINITLDLYSHVLPDMQEHAAAAMSRIFGSSKQPISANE